MVSHDQEVIEKAIGAIGPLDQEAMAAARARQDQLTKPRGSLGRLEGLTIQLAGIRREAIPHMSHKAIITMAGDHGVVAEGVSAYPSEVTAQMVYNFLEGGAAISVLAKHIGARVVVVDMGVSTTLKPSPGLVSKRVAPGTANMARGPAMSREQAAQAVRGRDRGG